MIVIAWLRGGGAQEVRRQGWHWGQERITASTVTRSESAAAAAAMVAVLKPRFIYVCGGQDGQSAANKREEKEEEAAKREREQSTPRGMNNLSLRAARPFALWLDQGARRLTRRMKDISIETRQARDATTSNHPTARGPQRAKETTPHDPRPLGGGPTTSSTGDNHVNHSCSSVVVFKYFWFVMQLLRNMSPEDIRACSRITMTCTLCSARQYPRVDCLQVLHNKTQGKGRASRSGDWV